MLSSVVKMGDVTIKSLFREDLQRFKMARDGATLAGVRSQLETQHRGMLPPNFVIKYEWGVASLSPHLSLSSPLALSRSLSRSLSLSRARSLALALALSCAHRLSDVACAACRERFAGTDDGRPAGRGDQNVGGRWGQSSSTVFEWCAAPGCS